MSFLTLSYQCSTETISLFGFDPDPKEPDHDACSGGYTQPGLIGGWSCSCYCHLKKENNDSTDNRGLNS